MNATLFVLADSIHKLLCLFDALFERIPSAKDLFGSLRRPISIIWSAFKTTAVSAL